MTKPTIRCLKIVGQSFWITFVPLKWKGVLIYTPVTSDRGYQCLLVVYSWMPKTLAEN